MEQRISIERMEQAINIFGSFDENIRLLEQEFSVSVVNRDGELRVSGEPEDTMLAAKAIQALLTLSSRGESIADACDVHGTDADELVAKINAYLASKEN